MKKITDAWIRKNISIPDGLRVVDQCIIPDSIEWVMTGALVTKGRYAYHVWELRAPLFTPYLEVDPLPYVNWSKRFSLVSPVPLGEPAPELTIETTEEILARRLDESMALNLIADSLDALDCAMGFHQDCRLGDCVAAANWLAGRPDKAIDVLECFLVRARSEPDFVPESEAFRIAEADEFLSDIRAGKDGHIRSVLQQRRDQMYHVLKLD